jgi:hypothetical protein
VNSRPSQTKGNFGVLKHSREKSEFFKIFREKKKKGLMIVREVLIY